ncbi:hypothetical protein CRUP_023760 [Coryphaenoides rupestris]|nr:hypothetical protein CRUP_023760 [Coryphaenoides rupestris]
MGRIVQLAMKACCAVANCGVCCHESVFTLLLGPFTFFNAQKTKYLQILTSLMRWIGETKSPDPRPCPRYIWNMEWWWNQPLPHSSYSLSLALSLPERISCPRPSIMAAASLHVSVRPSHPIPQAG